MTARLYDLVIFDCDGVLVDSEMLSAGVLMAMMEDIGLPITTDIFRSDFLGRSFASAAARAHQRFGRPLPDWFESRYREQLLDHMRRDLKPMPGIAATIDRLAVDYCLATSSSPRRLAVSLGATALASRFEGRCFTASEVKNGKPAPDLFFHAAARMGVAPARCIVIEDSEQGVRAGLAAGMAVCHFAGGAHMMAGYALPPDIVPDHVVDSAEALGSLFERLGIAKDVRIP
jgi:HAD superfamily hydrolase (TIGR01509 family)